MDTNGAGDRLRRRLLGGPSKGQGIAACRKAGACSASVAIQHSGCTCPARPDYAFWGAGGDGAPVCWWAARS